MFVKHDRNSKGKAGTVFISLLAGLMIYLFLLNRFLNFMKSGPLKNGIMLGFFFVFVIMSIVAARRVKRKLVIVVSCAVFAVCALWQIIQVVEHERAKASPPLSGASVPYDMGKPVTTTDVKAYYYAISIPKWKGGHIRIAHVTDIHVSDRYPMSYYARVSELIRSANPTFVFFTGDFVTDTSSLALLEPVIGLFDFPRMYASLGNHDYWVDAEQVKATLVRANISVIQNETVRAVVNGMTLNISGYDKPWGNFDYVHFAPGAPGPELSIVLSHNPDNIYTLSKRGADMVLAGHYHAGQVRIPLFGAVIVPSMLGRRFDYGHFLVGGSHLFVSAGIGTVTIPVRIYCYPDIFIIDIN